MDPTSCVLVGAPVDSGKTRKGCLMGPDAYRTAGLAETLIELGHTVTDAGNVVPTAARPQACANPLVHSMAETVAWTEALAPAAKKAAAVGLPIFMGGDHALWLGTVAGMAAHAVAEARPLFVLWLDAHTDLHTPLTTNSGNLHGTPVAYVAGPRWVLTPSRRSPRWFRLRISA